MSKKSKKSSFDWAEFTEILVYKWIQLSATLRLIPFTTKVEDSAGRYQKRLGHKMSPGSSEDDPVLVGGGNRRKQMFTKYSENTQWDRWLYQTVTVVYVFGNMSRFYRFFKRNGLTSIKIDILFAADMFLFASIIFAMVFKTAVWYCSNDLIFLLNELDRDVARMRLGLRRKRAMANPSKINRYDGQMDTSKLAENDENDNEQENKYCWFSTIQGQMGVLSSAYTASSAFLAISALLLYAVEWRKLNSLADYFWMAVDNSIGSLLAFVNCQVGVTSIFTILMIILNTKIQLSGFQELAYIEAKRQTKDEESEMTILLGRFRKLQVANAYGNGYFRVLFPGYVGVSQMVLISVLYVALTGYAYLPVLIYAAFPLASVFVFTVLIMLFMSQVGTIFRQSHIVCLALTQVFAQEFSKEVDRHGRHEVDERRRQIKQTFRTIRPFGYFSGFYGKIDQKTPATMTENILNCMILLLNLT